MMRTTEFLSPHCASECVPELVRLVEGLTTMIDWLHALVSLFPRCLHRKVGPLITLRPGVQRSGVAALTGTYFVCVKCGKQFAYDWDQMRVIDPEPSRMRLLAGKAGLHASKTS
jgi:hypothetical protein